MSFSDRFKDFELALENQKQVHTKTNILLALSRLFERSFYYGIRAVLFLYATSEILQMDNSQAVAAFGIMGSVIIITRLVGGLLGDVLVGHKRMTFLGGILQVIGALALSIPSITMFYIGIGMISIGSGFYASNFMAVFAKSYFKKLKLLDSGFTLIYGLVNVGSFIGVLLIGFLSEILGYNIGFVITAGLMIISILFLHLSKIEVHKTFNLPRISLNSRILTLVFGVMLFIGFWVVFNLTSSDVSNIDDEFYRLMEGKFLSNFSMRTLHPIVVTLGSIGLFALWTFYRIKSSFKMILGVLLGLLGLVIIYYLWPNLTKNDVYIFSLAICILAIAELLITPILFSIIAKYTNAKYIATLMGSVAIMARVSYLISDQFKGEVSIDSTSYLDTGIIILASLLILGFLFSYFSKNRQAS